MNSFDKIEQLKQVIDRELSPLISQDYVLLDVPYHNNIGDVLIWNGELAFLNKFTHRCLKMTDCKGPIPNIAKDSLILLHGGGNFGDLWRTTQEYRLEVIRKYPNNKIIIFPQTVHYENFDRLKDDASIMSKHENLIICARDKMSFSLLKEHFTNEILLVPDMAFYIDSKQLKKSLAREKKKTLYLRRTDKELKCNTLDVDCSADVRDWPSMENGFNRKNLIGGIFAIINRVCRSILDRTERKSSTLVTATLHIRDFYARYIFRPFLTRTGVKFISGYSVVYSTRLHAIILSVLINKRVNAMDNSYKKNSSFCQSWFNELESVNNMFD